MLEFSDILELGPANALMHLKHNHVDNKCDLLSDILYRHPSSHKKIKFLEEKYRRLVIEISIIENVLNNIEREQFEEKLNLVFKELKKCAELETKLLFDSYYLDLGSDPS